MGFKNYLLTEQRDYFASRVADILTAVHELVSAGKQVGARQLLRHTEGVVNQIRKILHTTWPRTNFKHLRKLQKCGVALMKTIDEKGDLRETLNSVRHELEQLSGKLGQPINDLGVGEKEEKKEKKQPQQMPQPDMQQQQPEQMPPEQPGMSGIMPDMQQQPQMPPMMPGMGGMNG